ncbi:MAG: TCR/Tet family MFS transporter [Bacteroidia bacterium]|jgi:DHA1 family tetracycline resistance protein-like MFS transporter|nr:TCR/Tet family MFS transporter [Bacteroidia bacterium]
MNPRQTKQALLFIFITIFIDVVGLGIIIPVLPGLLEKMTGLEANEASQWGGVLAFAYAAMQFLFSPLLGSLSDKFGRRPVLLMSLLGFGLDYLLLGFAPTVGWLFLGRLVAGITGASFTVAGAYIADISPEDKREQNFGLIGAAFGLGFIAGPAIGGLLASYGERVPFFVAAGLSLCNALYGFFVIPESLQPENRRRFEWKRANPVGALISLSRYPLVLRMGVAFFLINMAGQSLQSVWSFYTEYRLGWEPGMIGLSLAFVGIMVALVQGGLNRVLIPKLGNRRAILIGIAMYGVGMFIAGMASSSFWMFASVVPLALGGLAGPTIQGILSKVVGKDEQGELQGFVTSVVSLTAMLGPVLMTTLFAWFTDGTVSTSLPGAPYFASTFFCVVALVWMIFVLKKFKVS